MEELKDVVPVSVGLKLINEMNVICDYIPEPNTEELTEALDSKVGGKFLTIAFPCTYKTNQKKGIEFEPWADWSSSVYVKILKKNVMTISPIREEIKAQFDSVKKHILMARMDANKIHEMIDKIGKNSESPADFVASVHSALEDKASQINEKNALKQLKKTLN